MKLLLTFILALCVNLIYAQGVTTSTESSEQHFIKKPKKHTQAKCYHHGLKEDEASKPYCSVSYPARAQ
jgi:hypothetical protein